jgi:integral membrane protein
VVSSAEVGGHADPDGTRPVTVDQDQQVDQRPPAPPKDPLRGALIRYRVMTYIVGSALIVLVCLGVPLQVWAHFDLVAKVEGTIHGYLYLVYLFTAADLARRAHWRLGRILAVVLSGFVPFLAFIVEHRVVVQMRAERAELLAAQGFGPEALAGTTGTSGSTGPTGPTGTTGPATG